ncbi:TIGR02270 family protein [Caballeronia novacaledonica]|uniref:TIGR02270 family protein n=1 Tax=Caballeronia novacaledonica TaxID=1544861 RepID=UPI001EE30C4A|nr:TIGR02270 family protein [Caballeronia novacaledonica]GJH13235.1 TIGR02270 family protein [Caballeronia novacaledonica]
MSVVSPSVARFTGFAPGEISALVNRRTVEEHASEAAFLWMHRQRAVRAPHFKLKQLHKLDARVVAHLQGLTVPGAPDGSLANQALGRADAGAVFVASYAAFFAADAKRMRNVLKVALTDPILTDALIHAIAWLSPDLTISALERLQASPVPAHRLIALSVAAMRRSSVASDELVLGVEAADPVLRARALRALGELGRHELRPLAQTRLNDPDDHCRFWAARSLAVLGDADGACATWAIGLRHAELRMEATSVAMRCGDPDWARNAIRVLAKEGRSLRLTAYAAGEFGDPVVMPWLLDRLTNRACARVAGEAIASITGADLEYLDLDTDPPDDAEAHDEAHPDDAELRWPDAATIRAWWEQRKDSLQAGVRHLCGQPVGGPTMISVLHDGYQRQRRGAAIELARARTGVALFPVEQRADQQLRRLAE